MGNEARTNRKGRALSLAALAVCFATHEAHALTVDIQIVQQDFCGQSVGMLEAIATDGTEPYRYDWYQVVGGTPALLCADCGSTAQGLAGGFAYKVVVTDDLGAEAEFTTDVWVEDLEIGQGGLVFFPYVASELPYIKVYPNANFTGFLPPNGSLTMDIVGGELYWEPEPQELGVSAWWFTATAGSGTINTTYMYNGGQCTVATPFVIPPPTVIPEMSIIDVQGSCSNAPTGSLTVALNNGYIPEYLHVFLGGWHQLAGQPQYGVVATNTTTIITVDGLSAGSNTLHLTGGLTTVSSPGDWGFPYLCHDSVEFVIPNLGPTCSLVQGKVFIDANSDCAAQFNEAGVPGMVVEVQPGDHFGSTDAGGNYALVLPNGNYTVALQSAVIEEHCTTTPVPFTMAGSAAPVTVDMPSLSLVPLDARIALGGSAARPGFEYRVALSIRNLTPTPSGAATVTLDFDPVLGYLSANPAPASVNGTLLTWNQPQLGPFEQRTIQVHLQVPPDVGLIGTAVQVNATLSTAVADADASNNAVSMARIVTGSYDPNDKLASTSTRASNALYFIDADEWIDYTIRFQNTGTDTAFHVIITDTLPATLDPGTVEIGAASHAFTWELRDAGTLKFRFLDILLPDSNVNEPLSHGFVGFRIRPRLPLLPGTAIENTANIYFDYNPPVITEPSVLTAEFSTGVNGGALERIALHPNPSQGTITLVGRAMVEARVLDMSGRVVHSQRTAPADVLRCDLDALGAGTFAVEVRTANGSTTTLLLMMHCH